MAQKQINNKDEITIEAEKGIVEIEAFLADVSKEESMCLNAPHPAKIHFDEVELSSNLVAA